MNNNILLYATIFSILISTTIHAQREDPRVISLRDRILERIPDVPAAARGLGRGNDRPLKAHLHAAAIVRASDIYADEWRKFSRDGKWSGFSVSNDLPALIAAIAYKESSFQPVIRLDDNSRVYTMAEARYRGDMGYMQVRIPGSMSRACGITRENRHQIIDDHNLNYEVGVCILTNSMRNYISEGTPSMAGRPNYVRRFFDENPELRDLVIIEKYNWGGRDLRNHPSAGGYSVRILQEFMFFRNMESLVI